MHFMLRPKLEHGKSLEPGRPHFQDVVYYNGKKNNLYFLLIAEWWQITAPSSRSNSQMLQLGKQQSSLWSRRCSCSPCSVPQVQWWKCSQVHCQSFVPVVKTSWKLYHHAWGRCCSGELISTSVMRSVCPVLFHSLLHPWKGDGLW